MADYFTILKRAVDAAPNVGREQRQAIYDKARKALLAQLQNMDPPLAASEISKQRMALEEAVRAVERELDLEQQAREAAAADETGSGAGTESDAAALANAGPSAPTVSLKPADGAAKKTLPSDTGEGQAAQAPKVAVVAKDAGKAPVVSASQSKDHHVDENETSDPVVKRAGPDVLKHAVRDANALGAATNAAVKSAQDAADAVGDGLDDKKKAEKPQKKASQERIEPTMTAPVARPVVQPKGPVKPDTKQAPKLDPRDKPASVPSGASFKDELEEETSSGSRLGWIVGGVLLAGLLGGSGYLLFQNREAFISDDSGSQQVVSKPATQSEAGQGSVNKSASESEIPAKSVRTVDIPAPSQADEGSNATANEQDLAQNQDQSATDTATDALADPNLVPTNGEPVAGSNNEAGQNVAVAQRSILYEEEGPNGQPGSANPGEVLWELEGQGDTAEILISATIPNQNVTFSIKVAKNRDAELPASHLIEISADRPTPDAARAIVKIPGLILKPTEQSRGEGLVGAAIKIADDLHWIALTAGEKEERYNLELLTLRSWIDIPIQYNSGVRAILTLEKGAAGERVIEDAIKAWGGE